MWIKEFSKKILRQPKNRKELITLLRDAKKRHILDTRALAMIEGAISVTQTHVRDVMLPRAQMVSIEHNATLESILPIIIKSHHSRFPVLGKKPDEIIGILLAKDLLRYFNKQNKFNINEILHPAVFIPESKRLNTLLEEFRLKHNHMAIVVDEYGGIAGLVTIEDVLEEIVGEIEDEYDAEDDAMIIKLNEKQYTVKALCPIEEFNQHFNTLFSDEEFDTIGGLIMSRFGHLPKRGETIVINDLHFKVLHADKRRVGLFRVTLS